MKKKAVVCANCVFWNKSSADSKYGYCRRYPPQAIGISVEGRQANTVTSYAPCTHFDEWCGEYRERKNDADRGQS